jgi:flagellin-like protein
MNLTNKKGLSGVVTAVILIGLTVAAVSIVWVFVSNLVNEELEDAESCLGIYEKFEIRDTHTCYNTEVNDAGVKIPSSLKISLSIGDVDIDEVLVSVVGKEETQSFKISKDGTSESFLGSNNPESADVEENYGSKVYLVGKNSGKNYYVDLSSFDINIPQSVKVTPIVGEETCSDAVSSAIGIPNCAELVN